MNISARIVTLLFTLISGFYFLYQILLGNPFHDPVHPAIVHGFYFAAGIFSMIIVWRKKLSV